MAGTIWSERCMAAHKRYSPYRSDRSATHGMEAAHRYGHQAADGRGEALVRDGCGRGSEGLWRVRRAPAPPPKRRRARDWRIRTRSRPDRDEARARFELDVDSAPGLSRPVPAQHQVEQDTQKERQQDRSGISAAAATAPLDSNKAAKNTPPFIGERTVSSGADRRAPSSTPWIAADR
jgi:hypothetical protein